MSGRSTMASRKDDKEKLRQERLAREAAEQERAEQRAKARKYAAIGGGVILLIAVIVGVVVAAGGGGSKDSSTGDTADKAASFANGPAPTKAIAITDGSQKDLLAAAKQAGCKFNADSNEGRTHEDPSTDFKYKANPPTSGNHTPTWAEDGAYPEATWATPYLVHALEHGRIEYLWDEKKLTPQQVGSLKKLYDDDSYHLILHPDTTAMPYAIAATAWDHSLTCPKMNDDVFAALRLFKLNWVDQGPEQVP